MCTYDQICGCWVTDERPAVFVSGLGAELADHYRHHSCIRKNATVRWVSSWLGHWVVLMMGLGYRQSHKKLMNPEHLHALRRADEDLGDLVILGAVFSFGIGTFSWLVLSDVPPRVFYYYPEREEYLAFLYALMHLSLLSALFIWFLDTARTWPRIAIVVVATLAGIFFLLNGVLGGEGPWEIVANSIALLYAAAIVVKTVSQLRSLSFEWYE